MMIEKYFLRIRKIFLLLSGTVFFQFQLVYFDSVVAFSKTLSSDVTVSNEFFVASFSYEVSFSWT